MITLRDLPERWRELDSGVRLRAGCLLIALLAVALAWSALAERTGRLERRRAAREAVLRELLPLRATYRAAKLSAQRLGSRMSAVRPDDSPARMMEDTGIRGRNLKVTPLRGEERDGLLLEVADVRLEGLSASEAINLLYRLEKGGRPVLVRKANLRVRFDDPARFDLALTVALLKPDRATER